MTLDFPEPGPDLDLGFRDFVELDVQLPKDFAGKSYTADLKITPDGKHLYGTNRGHDSLAGYAIDAKTGKELWHAKLPAGGQANPMVYEQGGRQYVVIMAGGHHFMETPAGDYVMAYALPE